MEKMSFNRILTDDAAAYASSLLDPWKYGCKIPLGFNVKSVANSLNYKIPVSSKGTLLTVGGIVYTLTNAGNPVAFSFNPNLFDDGNILQFSAAKNLPLPVTTFFTDWIACLTSKGYSTQYSKYRIVSAGIKFICTDAIQYAKGLCSVGIFNHVGYSSFGAGSGGYSLYISDGSTDLKNIAPGLLLCATYDPVDIECLGFIDTSVVDAARQDWNAVIAFDSYDSVNGFSGYFDIVINYELIVKGAYSELIPSTVSSHKASEDMIYEVVNKVKEKKRTEGKDKGTTMSYMNNIDAALSMYPGYNINKSIFSSFYN